MESLTHVKTQKKAVRQLERGYCEVNETFTSKLKTILRKTEVNRKVWEMPMFYSGMIPEDDDDDDTSAQFSFYLANTAEQFASNSSSVS